MCVGTKRVSGIAPELSNNGHKRPIIKIVTTPHVALRKADIRYKRPNERRSSDYLGHSTPRIDLQALSRLNVVHGI